jgi:predicted DNA-binding transcriptional regulator AlpA
MRTTTITALVENRLTIDATAFAIGQAKQTLYQWRNRGIGPRSYKLGNRVFYDREDVERWIAEQKELTGVGA